MKLIAIDLGRQGAWAYFEDGKPKVWESFALKGKEVYLRMMLWRDMLSILWMRYHPTDVACERYLTIPGRPAPLLYVLLSILQNWADSNDIELHLVSPARVKRVIAGYGRATKWEVWDSVNLRLRYEGIEELGIREGFGADGLHISDAIALGLCVADEAALLAKAEIKR